MKDLIPQLPHPSWVASYVPPGQCRSRLRTVFALKHDGIDAADKREHADYAREAA